MLVGVSGDSLNGPPNDIRAWAGFLLKSGWAAADIRVLLDFVPGDGEKRGAKVLAHGALLRTWPQAGDIEVAAPSTQAAILRTPLNNFE